MENSQEEKASQIKNERIHSSISHWLFYWHKNI